MPDWNWEMLSAFFGPALATGVAGMFAFLGVRHGLKVLRALRGAPDSRNHAIPACAEVPKCAR